MSTGVTLQRNAAPKSLAGITHRWFRYDRRVYGVRYQGKKDGYEILDSKGNRVAGGYPSLSALCQDAARAIGRAGD